MHTRQATLLDALWRTKEFLDANQDSVGTVNTSSARRNLDEITTRLAALGAEQDGSTRASAGETARQRTLRAELCFTHIRPIAVIAKRKLERVPEFRALTVPTSGLTVKPLLAAARGIADAAKRHADLLIENGLQDDFIEQLRAAALKLEQSVDDRHMMHQSRTRLTAALAAEEGRGRDILRVLDSVMRPRLRDNQLLLARWNATVQTRHGRSAIAGA